MEEGEISVQEDGDKQLIVHSEDDKPSSTLVNRNLEEEDVEDDRESSVLMKDDHFQKFYASMYKDDHPDPLDLKLQVTSEFLDKINGALSVGHKEEPLAIENVPLTSDKMRDGNFQAEELIIGSWNKVAQFPNELVVKVYYATRKLIWEVLYFRCKKKIEIQWDDILALQYLQNGKEVLEVELSKPPTFFHEPELPPRSHAQWKPAQDFTDGQALKCRRHKIICAPGSLSKELARLLQHDNRLNELNKHVFPSRDSPYFDSSHLTNFPILNSSDQFLTGFFNKVPVPSLDHTQRLAVLNSALIQQQTTFASHLSGTDLIDEVPMNVYAGVWKTGFTENAQPRNSYADSPQSMKNLAYDVRQATNPTAFYGNNNYSHQAAEMPNFSGNEYLNNQIQKHASDMVNSAGPLFDEYNVRNSFVHQDFGTHGTYGDIDQVLPPALDMKVCGGALYEQSGTMPPQFIDQSLLLSSDSQNNIPSHMFPALSDCQNHDQSCPPPSISDPATRDPVEGMQIDTYRK